MESNNKVVQEEKDKNIIYTNNKVDDLVSSDSDTENISDQDETQNYDTTYNDKFKKDSELYIVTHNGVPKFYTKTSEEACKQMWDLARLLRFQETQFNTYIRERNNSYNIEVVGYNKFSIINVDRIIHFLSVQRVYQIDDNQNVLNEDEDKDQGKNQEEDQDPVTSSSLYSFFT